jgi:hypothetical protein
MGATAGQILKWNGTTWIAADDTTGRYFAGAGIAISNDSIINIGDQDSTNDVTIDRISANGEVLGKFDSLYIKDGAVRTAKLADTSVTGSKINQMGATAGQILKWNGTTWIAADDTTGKYFAGAGIAISNDTIINTGDRDSTNDVTIDRISSNGEVLGKFDSLYIKNGSVTANKLSFPGATEGMVLTFTNSVWTPKIPSIPFFTSSRDTSVANSLRPAHSFMPLGAENNIDIVLSPKGAASLLANMPDDLIIGGEKRGAYSVDLQMSRLDKSQVARAQYSVIAGGISNKITALGNYSVIGGGSTNSISTTYATISGGIDNVIGDNGNYSAISGGSANSISANFGFIGGGSQNNVNKIGGIIGGGTLNTVTGIQYSSVLGGYGNTASGNRTAVGGGSENETDSEYSVVSGGYRNKARADRSAIFGGAELTLSGTATGSFGFNANRITGGFTDRAISVTEANTGIFNNVNLWLTNNDNSTRTLRFYEAYNTAGAFPSGTNYVGFRAPSSISADVTWTLPSADGATNQVLKTNGSGILTWANDNGDSYTAGSGISIVGSVISNTGDTDSTDDMPIETVFWGDVVDATYSALPVPSVELQLGIGSVTEDEIQDFTITEWDLGTLGATSSGQVLRYDGSKWGASDPGILYFEATRSSTVPNNAIPAHKLSPLGSEANIDFVLQPKGNGSLIAAIPSNSLTSSGVKRGLKSVDFQLERLTKEQVAKGNYSVLIGGDGSEITQSGAKGAIIAGSENYLNGSYSGIISGQYNVINSSYSFIGSGKYNRVDTSSSNSFIGAGLNNRTDSSFATISGGSRNRIRAPYASIAGGDTNVVSTSGRFSNISGGILNVTNNWYSNVSGGAANSALGEGSSVLGGIEMVLETTARNSFGFNGNILNNTNSMYARKINISEPRTGVFNNVHLWLTNNDDTVRTLRFYERYNQQGTFPNGANYVGFKAPNTMSSDVIYTLPASAPTSDGQMLIANSAGTMSWSPGIVRISNVNVNPGLLNANGGSESIAVNVTGAQVGGTVQVSPRDELEAGIIIGYARVSAANTVSVRFVNTTSSNVNPAAVGIDISVIQP